MKNTRSKNSQIPTKIWRITQLSFGQPELNRYLHLATTATCKQAFQTHINSRLQEEGMGHICLPSLHTIRQSPSPKISPATPASYHQDTKESKTPLLPPCCTYTPPLLLAGARTSEIIQLNIGPGIKPKDQQLANHHRQPWEPSLRILSTSLRNLASWGFFLDW